MKVVYNSKEIGDNYNNYNRLVNKPLINSTELVGNITLNDINVYTKDEVKKLISSARSVKTAINLPSPLTPNTTYYIGPNEHNIYTVYLTDSSDPINAFVIGTTSFGKYYSGEGINVTDDTNIVSVLVDSESVIINSEGLLEARPVFEKMVPFKGATIPSDGTQGIVPKPEAGDQDSFLMGSATWRSISDLINLVHPVGSFFISSGTSQDPNTLFSGTTWVRINDDNTLQTITSGSPDYIAAGLPDIRGSFGKRVSSSSYMDKGGAFKSTTAGQEVSDGVQNGGAFATLNTYTYTFNAHDSNSIYASSGGTVRPASVTITLWRRTA